MHSINEVLHWLMPWEPSVFFSFVMAATAITYIRGCTKQPLPIIHRVYFWVGFISIYIVSHTYFDYYSEHAFFMHRIQHTVLHHIGPFLIALSRPGKALSQGLPKAYKSYALKILHSKPVCLLADILNYPVVAVLTFTGLILFWLVSPIHFIAMLDWRLYRVMNWGMALNGLMFWNMVLNNYSLKLTHLSAASRIGIMLAIIPLQIVIGALLFLAPRELYPIYTLCGRALAITPMADQQIGGLILWIPAAMMSVIGIVIVIRREWLNKAS